MKNFGNIMKQAQQAQAKMQEAQAKLEQLEVTGQSGAGMVQVVVTGKGEMRSVKIDPSLVDPKDIEVLEDLIVAACNDARGKVEAASGALMAEAASGLKLPGGMKLPF